MTFETRLAAAADREMMMKPKMNSLHLQPRKAERHEINKQSSVHFVCDRRQ